MKNFALKFAAPVLCVLAAPAAASTVVTAQCQDLTVAGASCLFNGNINGLANAGNVNSYKSAEAAYNALSFGDITLNYIAGTDEASFGGFGSAAGNAAQLGSSTTGTWSLPGYSVSYVGVKAGTQFVLLNVGGVSSGSWDTLLIPYLNKNGRGNPKALSHLTFFGDMSTGAVPEPSAWALLILGFGGIGAAMRQRKGQLRLA